ncbi:MAG: outer membrane lipoprotein carrier protein LolA [Gemmatimonadota bacterium]|nr:outer membrane lipoprotein carrier protein LolA [Gemmatimonadota bacterium]
MMPARTRGRTPGRAAAARRAVLLLAVAMAAHVADAAAVRAQDEAAPEVRALLARARDVYERLGSLRAEFDQTIAVPLLGRERSGSGDWFQKGRGRFKMDFRDPAGDVIVADGEHLWLYYPSTHPDQVIRTAIEANVTGAGMVDLQGRIFAEADRYDAVLEGREDVAGHATWRIRLTPRGASPYRAVRVWVDAGSYLVRRFEITEENETVRTVILRELRPDATIPDSVFRFEPPPAADVFEG